MKLSTLLGIIGWFFIYGVFFLVWIGFSIESSFFYVMIFNGIIFLVLDIIVFSHKDYSGLKVSS